MIDQREISARAAQDDALHKLRMKQLEINLRTGGAAEGGVTVRDYFAARAMQGIMSAEHFDGSYEDVSMYAYKCADAMMGERNRPFEKPTPSVEEAFGLGRNL